LRRYYIATQLRDIVEAYRDWEGRVPMKTEKYLSLFLFVVFLAAGIYFLQDAANNSGRYAEGSAFAGAVLSALALAAVGWSIRLHLHRKALHRHLRLRSR
jgi:hypothetical protein